jgi:hypothetical protein
MAIIERFERLNQKTFRIQPTAVVCHYAVFEPDAGKRILQLDTHGSKSRDIPGKVSQTLQLDQNQARALWEILRTEFDFR